jgi:hypothetical protein
MALMRARPGSDPTGYVEYYFEETSGNAGATSSGWQLSPRYLDTGLVYGETYSYRVKMRDRAGNQGAFSEEHSFELIQVLELCPGVDQDSDCDTVPNAEELDEDTDGDGIPNVLDTDDDGDSFSTKNEKEDGLIWGIDNDQDGKPTWVDMDSDGDSYSDYLEGGGDNNFNQIPGYLDPDEPCGDGACASEQGELHENCSTCPADCSCPAGSSCVEATCKEG